VTVPTSSVGVMGVGASPLIAELAAAGYSKLTAVDISASALDQLRTELGLEASNVCFVRDDVRTVSLPSTLDLWHDRATFHFLTSPNDQEQYATTAAAAVRPGGHLVMVQFAADGPKSCSGLAVARQSAGSLSMVFMESFDLIESFEQDHETPSGSLQRFVHAVFVRRSVGQ
jgi:SAM-dependent methyltransferase